MKTVVQNLERRFQVFQFALHQACVRAAGGLLHHVLWRKGLWHEQMQGRKLAVRLSFVFKWTACLPACLYQKRQYRNELFAVCVIAVPSTQSADCLHYTVCFLGQDGSVGTAPRYGLKGPQIESRKGGGFSVPIQTGSGAHPASCTMSTGSPSPRTNRPGRDVDYPPQSSAKVKEIELYSKTCLKRNAIVPVFFSVFTGFRFTKGCVLIKQSTKNMIA